MSSLRRRRTGQRIACVTGGAGFLGTRVVHQLAETGDYDIVRVLDVKPFEGPEEIGSTRIEVVAGSVCDIKSLRKCFQGAEVVFHVAALIDWGQRPYQVLYEVNVIGTQMVLAACIMLDIPYLVATSTMDVVCWKDRHNLNAEDDDLTVPVQVEDFHYGGYGQTKAVAEALVRDANSRQLATTVIRPTGIYGERDPYHLPNVLDAAYSGQLVLRMGHPGLVFQHCHVDNIAHAHICAARSLRERPEVVGGNAYIITEGEAENFFDFIEPMVRAHGIWFPPRWLYLPGWLAMLLARVMVSLAWVVSPVVSWTPTLTPATVRSVLYSQSFTGAKARRDLGYRPIVSHEEGQRRTLEYFRSYRPANYKGASAAKQN